MSGQECENSTKDPLSRRACVRIPLGLVVVHQVGALGKGTEGDMRRASKYSLRGQRFGLPQHNIAALSAQGRRNRIAQHARRAGEAGFHRIKMHAKLVMTLVRPGGSPGGITPGSSPRRAISRAAFS